MSHAMKARLRHVSLTALLSLLFVGNLMWSGCGEKPARSRKEVRDAVAAWMDREPLAPIHRRTMDYPNYFDLVKEWGREGQSIEGAEESIWEMLEEESNPDKRAALVDSLAWVGTPSSTPLLIAILERGSEDDRVRIDAARDFVAIHDERAVPALLRAARDPSEGVRAAALATLVQYHEAPGVQAALEWGLQDDSQWVRDAVRYALDQAR